MKIDIKEALFWIFLILAIGLLLWNIFGNSPSEFVTIITLIFAVIIKLWSISNRQIRGDMKFHVLAKDFKEHINNKYIHKNV